MEEGHNLTIEQCKRITATAITGVDAFSDKQILLSYQNGRIVVNGSGMKIVNFSKTSGAFAATGEITAVRYLQRRQSPSKLLNNSLRKQNHAFASAHPVCANLHLG